jgi:Leucine-rich repeat (LRR) protein
LDDNQLTALPKTIGKLSDLEELILSQNDFETLPPCIGLLRKLNILNADDNMLEELPPGKFPQMIPASKYQD